MSRPDQILLIGLVYVMGSFIALARGVTLDPIDGGVGMLSLVFVSASVHYANEYADYFTDYLTIRTPFSGGSGALQRSGHHREIALYAAVIAGSLGLFLAVGCLLHGYPLSAAITLGVIALLGWSYSVGPALSRRGLGEFLNATLGGIVLPAYGFAVQAGRVTPPVLWLVLPFGILVFLNLLDTQWADRTADAAVGKRTLATRWEPSRLRVAYGLGILAWLGSLAMLWVDGVPVDVVLAQLAVLPLLLWGIAWYTRRRSPFPTVAAMVLAAIGQTLAWGWIAI